MAATLEQAGFESLWCTDHIILPSVFESHYPFADDGVFPYAGDLPWFDAVVAMTAMASATSTAEPISAVLVLPLRHPPPCEDVDARDLLGEDHGVALGVGAGWLAEEFEALGVDHASRGGRLDEWVELLHRCWGGSPAAFEGAHYTLPAGFHCQPIPIRTPPILVGGMSKAAIRRAAANDGWLALQRFDQLNPAPLAPKIAAMRAQAAAASRDPEDLRVTLRIIQSANQADQLAPLLPDFAAVGVDEVIIDVDWRNGGQNAPDDLERLRDAT
jgi:probable F420-dependent oxidoreductase